MSLIPKTTTSTFFKTFAPFLFFVVLINLGTLYLSNTSTYAQTVEQARQTPAPKGKKYQDYCDGRPSEHLIDTSQNSCLADYPGEFATAQSRLLSIIVFFIGLAFAAYKGLRANISAN